MFSQNTIECLGKNLEKNIESLTASIDEATSKQIENKSLILDNLDIRTCIIGKGISKKLFEKIQAHSFSSVTLAFNILKDKTDFCHALGGFLVENTSVEKLSLHYNHISTKDAEIILESLSKNSTLHAINLEGNGIDEIVLAKINKCLQNNQRLIQNEIEQFIQVSAVAALAMGFFSQSEEISPKKISPTKKINSTAISHQTRPCSLPIPIPVRTKYLNYR